MFYLKRTVRFFNSSYFSWVYYCLDFKFSYCCIKFSIMPRRLKFSGKKNYERKRQAAKRILVRMLLNIYCTCTIKILASGSVKHCTIFWFCSIAIVAIWMASMTCFLSPSLGFVSPWTASWTSPVSPHSGFVSP